jgi:hypothetical protein
MKIISINVDDIWFTMDKLQSNVDELWFLWIKQEKKGFFRVRRTSSYLFSLSLHCHFAQLPQLYTHVI